MMTKKDYTELADHISKNSDRRSREFFCEHIGAAFAAANPKFDWHKWRVACNGYNVPLVKVITPIPKPTPHWIDLEWPTPPTEQPKPMSDVKLGTIIEGTPGRDAIHVAVAPCVAAHYLCPGDHVGILEDGKAGGSPNPVGIVDPFLKEGVHPGQRFWVCLYQGTVTGMRHEWMHPAFGQEDTKSKSRDWIIDYASQLGLGYKELMSAANHYIDTEEYLCKGGDLESEITSEEFWEHYKVVTGKTGKGNFFSCSC